MPKCPTRLGGVDLRQLFPQAKFSERGDVRASSCTGDSRQVRQGDVFVAMCGADHDGHDYVDEAIRRGASAIVVDRPLPLSSAPVCLVRNARRAYGQLCQALAGDPSQHLKLVGVTGTNGKTTTSLLIAGVLEAAGHETGVSGTLGYFDGLETTPATHTTPPPPQLAQWLSRTRANGCQHAVLEVTSHALAQYRLAGIEFDVACVTNVQRDHLDFHGSADRYLKAKSRLLESLRGEGVAVFNVDDEGSRRLLADFHGPALTVGLEHTAEVTATIVERSLSHQLFLLHAERDTVAVETRLIGEHNVSNCLVAAAVGLSYGFDLATIARGLESVDRVPGRLERIECGQPFGALVDYAHTPDALDCVLSTLRPLTRGRLFCVFGAGGNRDRGKRPAMGQAVERWADRAIVTSDNPRDEDPAKIASEVVGGFSNRRRAEIVLDRAEAIALALSQAEEGDCVLVAGKGHEQMQIIGGRQRRFDDRQFVRQWLFQRPDPRPPIAGRVMPLAVHRRAA